MLTTIYLVDAESSRWKQDPDLRAVLRRYAASAAKRTNRRFWQIVASTGQIVAIGEIV